MPKFPHSTYSASPAAGVFVRGQGGPSPSVEADMPPPEDFVHPFLVKLLKVSNVWHFKVVPGTVNSKVPTLSGTALDSLPAPTKSLGSASGYVYLDMEYTEGTGFPDTFTVEYEPTVPADTDTKAYVALAYVDFSGSTAKKTAQYVLTSLWGERLKCGTNPAEYLFSRA